MSVKLEWLGYCIVENYDNVQPFWYNTSVLRTDGQTELLYQYRASVCWRAIKTVESSNSMQIFFMSRVTGGRLPLLGQKFKGQGHYTCIYANLFWISSVCDDNIKLTGRFYRRLFFLIIYWPVMFRCINFELHRRDVSACVLLSRVYTRTHVARRLFIYVTVDLYPFVSSNRRATNCMHGYNFCCRYKKHVDGNKWIQVDTTCVRQHVSWCKRGFIDCNWTLSCNFIVIILSELFCILYLNRKVLQFCNWN